MSILQSSEKGKSCGLDGLSSEHLHVIYSCERLAILRSLLFNTCTIHGYLPSDMISTVLIPIIKDKSGDVTDKSYYRSIALSAVVSKVLQHLLLNNMESFLYTSDNQFGSKAKHATDQCVYVLKEVIDLHRSHNSPVFISFMDASKAFDRVNHWTFLQHGIPHILVRLIIFWYRSQSVYVKWGSVISPTFSVLNGVRQGSPMLFNIYVDDLSSPLSSSKVGRIFGDQVINHISYVDDLVVFCPSSKGLQKCMYICESYGATHDIAYNRKKTVFFMYGNIIC